MRRHAARWGTGVAVALAVAAWLPAAAQAAPTDLDVFLSNLTIAADSPGRVMDIELVLPAEPVDDVTLAIDLTGVASLVSLQSDEVVAFTCTTGGPITTCLSERPLSHRARYGDFVFVPKAGAVAGVSGPVKVTASTPGGGAVSHTATLTIGIGVDLTSRDAPSVSARPGDRFQGTMTVTNAGENVVNGVVLWAPAEFPLRAGQRHSNCRYADDRLVSCAFDNTLVPGQTYEVALEYLVRPDTEAPASGHGIQFFWFTPQDWADRASALEHSGGSLGSPGIGPAAALEELAPATRAAPPQTDPEPFDAGGNLMVRVVGENHTDMAAVGASVNVPLGSTIDIPVGLKNLGPVTVSGDDFHANARVTIPAGSTATAVSDRCSVVQGDEVRFDLGPEPGHREYFCSLAGSLFEVGDTDVVTFTLRVDAPGIGTVRANDPISGPNYSHDINAANDTARIAVNQPGSGGNLPITGARTTLLAAVGGALLVLGVLGFVVARRRIRFAS